MPNAALADITARIDTLLAEVKEDALETPDPGWFNADEYAAEANVSIHTARHRLAELVKAGKLEARDLKVVPGKRRRYYFAG